MNVYFIAFIVALGVTYLVTPSVKRLAIRWGAVDKPDARRVHKGIIPRLGGLAIYAGFLASVLASVHLTWELVGLLTGGTGVFVMPAVPWIQSLGFEKDELVQALGISFTFSTLALALGLWWHNALPIQSLSLSALAIVPALIGQWIGTRVRRVISPLVFKRCFLFCLIGLGTEMMLRAV